MLVLHLTYTGGRTDLEKGVSVSKLESAAAEDGGWLKQYNRSLKIAKHLHLLLPRDVLSTCWTCLCRLRRVIDILSSTKYEGHDKVPPRLKCQCAPFLCYLIIN